MSSATTHYSIAFDSLPERNNKRFRGRGDITIMDNHVLVKGRVPAHILWKLIGGFLVFLVLSTVTEIFAANIAGPDHSPVTVLIPLVLSILLASMFSRSDKVEFTTDRIKDLKRDGSRIGIVASGEAASWIVHFDCESELEAKQMEMTLTQAEPHS